MAPFLVQLKQIFGSSYLEGFYCNCLPQKYNERYVIVFGISSFSMSKKTVTTHLDKERVPHSHKGIYRFDFSS